MRKDLTLSQCLYHLWQFLKPQKVRLFLGLLSVVILNMVYAAMPVTEGRITTQLQKDLTQMSDGIPGAHIQFDGNARILGILACIYAVKVLLQFVMTFLLTDAIQDTVYRLRNAVEAKISRLPVSYFDAHPAGELLSRITNDTDTVSIALQQTLARVLSTICTLLFCFIMMFSINRIMACMVLVILPVVGLISVFFMKKSQPYFDARQASLAKLNSVVNEMYTGASEIAAYNYQEQVQEIFSGVNQQLASDSFKAQFLSGAIHPATGFVTYVTVALCALYGCLQVLSGSLMLGNLQAFIRYIWNVNDPISQLSQLSAAVQSAFSGMNRLFSFLQLPEEVDAGTQSAPQSIDSVTFDQVDFSYTDKPLMQNVSFEAKAGQTVAIVGPTGAGKTTLTNLLLRFYDPQNGSIRINNQDIQSMPKEQMRSLYGLVLQDAWLFEGSVLENLRYGNEAASFEEVVTAARTAGIHDLIQSMPQGYDTLLKEDAAGLSQGEKQLMTIARAILKNPKILILDEATSSVDTRLEKKLQAAMDELMHQRTCFVIAHRLSTILNADLILVVENGQIIESGTHASLLAQNGTYARLYNSQFQDMDAEL